MRKRKVVEPVFQTQVFHAREPRLVTVSLLVIAVDLNAYFPSFCLLSRHANALCLFLLDSHVWNKW